MYIVSSEVRLNGNTHFAHNSAVRYGGEDVRPVLSHLPDSPSGCSRLENPQVSFHGSCFAVRDVALVAHTYSQTNQTVYYGQYLDFWVMLASRCEFTKISR